MGYVFFLYYMFVDTTHADGYKSVIQVIYKNQPNSSHVSGCASSPSLSDCPRRALFMLHVCVGEGNF